MPGAPPSGLTAANTYPVPTAAFALGLSPGVGLLVGALAVFRGRGGPRP